MTWTRFGHILKELQNPTAAQKVVDSIFDTIGNLKEFSEIGAELSSITDVESGYRFLVCGNYLAFYRVTGADVSIDSILYGRRDYLRILLGELS